MILNLNAAKFTNSNVTISSSLNLPSTIVVYHLERGFGCESASKTLLIDVEMWKRCFIGVIIN
jgi:hypothetical protein